MDKLKKSKKISKKLKDQKKLREELAARGHEAIAEKTHSGAHHVYTKKLRDHSKRTGVSIKDMTKALKRKRKR